MSRSTPRKNRNNQNNPMQGQQNNSLPFVSQSPKNSNNRTQYGHTRNNSSQNRYLRSIDPQGQATSDYESDAAYYVDSQPPPASAALMSRTNTELNLSVLRRYLPSISKILSVAANAVVFTFSLDNMAWEKANIEGPLFMCSQGEAETEDEWGRDGGCAFVLNRKGLDNLVLDLTTVSKHEMQGDLLIFRVEVDGKDGNAGGDRVVGLWIHPETEETRPANAAIIKRVWTNAREARQQREAVGLGSASQAGGGADVGPAMQAMGREISVDALFGRQNGAGFS